ncbi:uncharacterized protein LOC107042437 [Diachasma alloeum]|nr:uncharacterized protein LOC107042437 [Diachasma alloeum]
MPQSFLESGQNRVEIFPGAKFYLSSLSMAVIDRKVADADNKDKWKILIRQTLIHVYGKKLGLFSAKGAKVNSRPSINRQLFRGLVARAQTVSDEPIDEETLTKYINKMAFNKRRTSKVVINSENSESRKRAVANKGKLRKDVGSSSANNNLENHPPAQQLASVAQAIYQSPSNDINGNLGNLHSTPRLQDVHLSPLMHSNRSNNDPPPPSPGNLNAESGYHPSFSTFHHVGLDSHYGVEFAHAMEYSGRTTPFSGSSGRTYTQLH